MRADGFGEVVEATYGAARDPALWPRALTIASDHLGAIGGLLRRNGDSYCPDDAWMVVGRLDPERCKVFRQRHLSNEYSRRLRWAPPDAPPALASAVWAPEEARRSALHAEVLAPLRIEDQAILGYGPWSGGRGVGGFSFCLGERTAAAPAEALRKLARLAPHLRQALDLSDALGEARAAERGLTLALDGSPNAVLLLDAAGRVLHANRAAEALLRAGDGLSVWREPGGGAGRLSAARPEEARRLARAVAGAAKDGLGGRLRVSRPSGGADWPLLVVPLPRDEPGATGAGGRRPAVAVLVGGPGAPPDAGALRAAFGLSAAEARVLRAIAGGGGVPSAAAALGVSQETVRTHLARCFDATGTRTQAALAALVARLPGVAEGAAANDP